MEENTVLDDKEYKNINEKYQELRFNEWLDFLVEKESKGQWVRTLIGLGVLVKDEKTGKLKKTGKKVSKEEIKAAMKANKGGKEKNDAEQSGKKKEEKGGPSKAEVEKAEKETKKQVEKTVDVAKDLSPEEAKKLAKQLAKEKEEKSSKTLKKTKANLAKQSKKFVDSMPDEIFGGKEEKERVSKLMGQAEDLMRKIGKGKKDYDWNEYSKLDDIIDNAADILPNIANQHKDKMTDKQKKQFTKVLGATAAMKIAFNNNVRAMRATYDEASSIFSNNPLLHEKFTIEMLTHIVNVKMLLEEEGEWT